MKRLFSKKYEGNDTLGRMISSLRQARKSAGFRQAELGKLIGISRETVIHIEGFAECSVLSLECRVLKRWFSVCAAKISREEQYKLYEAIHTYMFEDFVLETQLSDHHASSKRTDIISAVSSKNISPDIPDVELLKSSYTKRDPQHDRQPQKALP